MLGLTLPQLIAERRLQASTPSSSGTFGRAKNVIFLYLAGGPPQHETFDPKPDAPAEIRGEFRPISTNVPGIQFCELLPRTARVADRLAVIRSMATDDNIHSSSSAWVLTGHKYAGRNARTIQTGDWPYFGSVVKMLRPSETLPPLSTVWIPDWMRLNENVTPAGQTGGLLGRAWDPERFIGDPAAADFRVEGMQLSDGGLRRLLSRKSLLEQLDRRLAQGRSEGPLERFDSYQQQTYDLLTSGRAVDAFRLGREPEKVRDRYGRNCWGQCVLLARRLIEAGVRLVHVQWPRMPGDNAVDNPLWDTHAQNADRLEDVLCPVFDVGFSALIEDLDQRGLLDETLVVAIGEFGRTPKINAKAGRDHWGAVFSFVMAGAGIRTAQVIGASDKLGGYPIEDRVQPGDLAATIYHLLGIDYRQSLIAQDGRALPIVHGQPIRKLLGAGPSTDDRTLPGGAPSRVPPYTERLLNYNDFPDGAPVRSFEGPSRPKGWRASPLIEDGQPGWGVRLLKSQQLPRRDRQAALGLIADPSRAIEIDQSSTAMLAQQVRSPFAGTFVLATDVAATASSATFYREIFLRNFTCRLLLFQYTDAAKSPAEHQVLASVDFQPPLQSAHDRLPDGDAGWQTDAGGQTDAGWQRVELRKAFLPDQPGRNISFGLGLGVAVQVEKTSPGSLTLPPGTGAAGLLHVARIDLDFAGKQRYEDVQV